MLSGKYTKLIRAFVSTALTASMLLSYFSAQRVFSADEFEPEPASETKVISNSLTDADGKTYIFTATYSEDSGLPADAYLAVSEILEGEAYDAYIESARAALDSDSLEYAHLFDISIMKDGVELQPLEGSKVNMQIELQDTQTDDLDVVHFPEETTDAELVENTTSQDGESTVVVFDAESFSIYAIVKAPPPPVIGDPVLVQTLDELANTTDTKGFLISYTNGTTKYMTNEIRQVVSGKGNVFVETNQISAASVWFLEKTGTANEYRIYTKINGENNYIIRTSGNYLGLTTSASSATAFVLENSDTAGKFYFRKSTIDGTKYKYLQHSNGGNGMRLYDGKGDNEPYYNSQLSLTYVSSLSEPDDYYKLDGKTYNIVFHEESVYGAGILSQAKTVSGQQRLTATSLVIRPNIVSNDGQYLIAKDVDLADWTFESKGKNTYYITTLIGGTKMYLTLDGNNLTLLDTPTEKSLITINSGTGENAGKYKFSVGGSALTLMSGKVDNGFGSSSTGGAYSWVNLAQKAPITEDDFVVYSAEKVDISSRTDVPDGAQVVIYTRIWNDTAKKYEFYAVNHDGTLVRCYESGDMIQWVGSNINTVLWDFTEYHYDDGTPNYYYELQNTYSGKYIAPKITGNQTLSDETIGLNLNGRRYGYYYSSILVWDTKAYQYAGIGVADGQIVPCTQNDAKEFYFAIMKPLNQTTHPTVETIDHTQYGIKMTIKDYNTHYQVPGTDMHTSEEQHTVLGNSDYNQRNGVKDLLTTNLIGEYPHATNTTHSLSELFENGTEVNHLFIANTYYSSGYYEFDRTQNFASFYKADGTYDPNNFTVYSELGTNDNYPTKDSMAHGQFLPFNKLSDEYSVTHPENLFYATLIPGTSNQAPLPDSDPRKGEKLRLVESKDDCWSGTDYWFGVMLEASFTQTPSGKDDWGHDIIYEFTGDDDFWLYVDGELIIDLGGIHSALAGSVNYCTGDVIVNGVQKNLRQIFEENYRGRNPNASQQDVDTYLAQYFEPGENIFKDYTTHEMTIFFMERGAGASNLHMRFNLASVKPGTVLLDKQVTGVSDTDSYIADYPFQIYYKTSDDVEKQLTPDDALGISVKYKDTTRDVTHLQTYEPQPGVIYSDVFFLKPGEIAVIDFPDETMEYDIKECYVNKNIYDTVTINGTTYPNGTTVKKTTDPNEIIPGREDFQSGYGDVIGRNKITFENHVMNDAKGVLTITKNLYDEYGNTQLHSADATFSYRLYLGTENDDFDKLPYADMDYYHVKNADGYYCTWDATNEEFVPTIYDDYDAVPDDEKLSITFTTSMNGSISMIPVDYTVEIRELQAGSRFKVEERRNEIPDGYSLSKYCLNTVDTGSKDPVTGTIEADVTTKVLVVNLKGWGIRMYKDWSDSAFMEQRDATYFALFTDDNGTLTLVPDSVRQLKMGDTSVYWFLSSLNNIDFDKYVGREVTISNPNPTVDEYGYVTNYGTIDEIIIPDDPNSQITLGGKQFGDTNNGVFNYTAKYTQGTLPLGSNVRVDQMYNKRAGIDIYKVDQAGNPLAGAVFTLTDGSGKPAGAATYTSDDTGLVTVAYLRENEEYTLTEISSPNGYHAMPDPIKITRTGTTVTITGGTSGYYTFDDTDSSERIALIQVANKPFEVEFKKTTEDGTTPLAGAFFTLYRQVQGVNGPRRDYVPVTGFENMETGSDGIVPLLTAAIQDGTIPKGTYYLSEVTSPTNYLPMSNDVVFTVTDMGTIVIDTTLSPSTVSLATQENASKIDYYVVIPNEPFDTRTVNVTKVVSKGTTADEQKLSSFTFTARLYLPDGVTPWDYAGFPNGVASFTLHHGETNPLVVPLGAVLTVTEDPNEAYTTKYSLDSGAAVDSSRCVLTVAGDHDLVYTNTRKTVTVTVKKTVVGNGGNFTFTARLEDAGVDCVGYTMYNNNNVNITTGVGGTAQFILSPAANATVSQTLTIPYGTSLIIEETQNPSYTTTVKIGNGNAVEGRTASLSNIKAGQTVTYTNTEQQALVPPTGLSLKTKSYMWMLCLAFPLFIPVLCDRSGGKKKRRKTDEGTSEM